MKAIDGDRGIDNRIVYSITRGGNGILQVEPSSGIVYTTRVLDREDPFVIKTGAIIIEIMVRRNKNYRDINISLYFSFPPKRFRQPKIRRMCSPIRQQKRKLP